MDYRDGNQTAGRDINTNTNVYGSSDSLLIVPSDSATVTDTPQPTVATVPLSEYALQVVEPPIIANPPMTEMPPEQAEALRKQLNLPDDVQIMNSNNFLSVAPGQEYKLNFVIYYRSQTPTMFYANILPDVDEARSENNTERYRKAHIDTISITGRPLEGNGTLQFSLTGTAPTEAGDHSRMITLGLMNYENWQMSSSIIRYEYPFTISVKN